MVAEGALIVLLQSGKKDNINKLLLRVYFSLRKPQID